MGTSNGPLESGKMQPNGLQINFKCAKGFSIRGPKQMTCTDGRWDSKRLPKCVGKKGQKCDNPGEPVHGTRGGAQGTAVKNARKKTGKGHIPLKFKNGDEVDYTCDTGFVLVGPKHRKCRNGAWTNSLPRCEVAYEVELDGTFGKGGINKLSDLPWWKEQQEKV